MPPAGSSGPPYQSSFHLEVLRPQAGAGRNTTATLGWPSQAFEYIKYNGGLETEEAYPYTGKDGVCKFSAENVAVQVLDSVNITLVLNYLISTLNELGFSALCIHSFFCSIYAMLMYLILCIYKFISISSGMCCWYDNLVDFEASRPRTFKEHVILMIGS